MTQPRLTISCTADEEIQISMNPEGRNALVKLLESLSDSRDHFHLFSFKDDDELRLSDIPYNKSDKAFTAAKFMFRLDEWDEKYFPHVMPPSNKL